MESIDPKPIKCEPLLPSVEQDIDDMDTQYSTVECKEETEEGSLPTSLNIDDMDENTQYSTVLEFKEETEEGSLPTSLNIDDMDDNTQYSTALECGVETEDGSSPKSLNDYIEKVAYNTGISKNVIKKAINEDLKDIDPNNKNFKRKERINIFKYIAEMYTNQDIPTYKNVFTLFKKNETVITFSQFQYMMSCLGFEYRKTELGQDILIEDPSLTFKRYLYLKHINIFRAKCAPVYYIDERVLDSTYTFPKIQIYNKDDNIFSPPHDGYIFIHAVSKQGFLSGLFCSPATKKDFLKWVSHILIPLLPRSSIIVMDNSELHGTLINTITKYHSKNDMMKYLRQKGIPYNEHLHKAELYELITKCSVMHACYEVDEILKVHGHHVLRLPSYFEDLSMTHFLWKYFCEIQPNLFSDVELPQIKPTLLEKLSRLPQELWDSFHDALLKAEECILKIDEKAYEALEQYFKIS